MPHLFSLLLLLAIALPSQAGGRAKYNFCSDWLLHIGDASEAKNTKFADHNWKRVTLPRAFNEDEAFRVSIEQLTDTIVWYRKHFRLPAEAKGDKVFVEFEGVRQGADFYLNGHRLGLHENGAMAVGFDLTPYINYRGDNVLSVRVDNNWDYHERATNTKYQWSDRNFNANYGGIPKNVWLHTTGHVYQTLPLYSNLKTTGVYIYADQIQVKSRKAHIHAEAQVNNELAKAQTVQLKAELIDRDGRTVKTFDGQTITLAPRQMATLKAEAEAEDLHFWSWGYGYLYTVKTSLWIAGRKVDEVATKTGFRKTRFADGKVWLNDRVLQMKGYAQRTSNEWPAVGMSVPAWLSDYSNGLMVEGNANLVRWMHITPWKQDVESCDRVGLIQSMQAGDAEKDVEGQRWIQRTELMRDAIIYNRNNPSILFYECGNESISRDHMIEMRGIRDTYDPNGGRAIGSREMLDIREAEYGGEMLYINKSKHSPMWAMEYCRDEGLRKYWDAWSYPYHKDGAGNNSFHSAASNTTKKNVDARAYNRNQDSFTEENVRRWYDYWAERPGTGTRCSSGGVKIIFSDSNTHYRGVENYRRSGSVDAMRIAKDPYFAHQVMWDGWVDVENPRIHIVGHWNYPEGTVKPVSVVSSADHVELLLNGHSLGTGTKEYEFLHKWDSVKWQPGTLTAVGYDAHNRELCRAELQTAGRPAKIRLAAITDPDGWRADGADLALIEAEVVDEQGRRCPLANDTLTFTVDGPAEWRGGLAQGKDNFILSENLSVECGVNRALLRSLTEAGTITLTAKAAGLESASLTLATEKYETRDGLSRYIAADHLAGRLTRGETPLTPSYADSKIGVNIASATAGANAADAANSFDDNELSEWRNDGRAATAWITYTLERRAAVDEVCIKLTGWRMRRYPIEILAGDTVVYKGETQPSLGYVHLKLRPVMTDKLTIRLAGSSAESDAFGQITEVAAAAAGELDLLKVQNAADVKHELRIVEVEFLENLLQ